MPVHDHPSSPCEGTSRRQTLKRGVCAWLAVESAALLPAHAFAAEPADARPAPGDRIVAVDADGAPKPLRPADIPHAAKPLQAFPFDRDANVVRNGSRLNKLLLLRLDPAAMDEDTRARSVEGVVAFSSVCTHQGCDVSEWVDAEKVLLCFCHFSKFDPARSGEVRGGPAPRNLPALPLKLVDGELVVAAALSSAPGALKPA